MRQRNNARFSVNWPKVRNSKSISCSNLSFTEKAYWIEDEIGNLEMMEKVEFLCVHYNGEELAALNGMLGDMGDEEQAERIAAEVTRIKAEQDAKWVKS